MSAATMRRPELTPAQRVAAARRARQIKSGEVRVPLACPTCFSSSLAQNEAQEAGVLCLSCGRVTKEALVKRIRQQRIRRFLLDGAL